MEYMARLGIGDRVRVISGITHSQMAAYYQAADLLVMPSREDETFGLVTLEALACGCPVFGFRACANEEIVRFKPFKFLAKNGDGAGLTELMAAYLALSGQSKTAIRKGVAQSVVYFRWSRAVGRLTALLKVV
jgi:glycosyltransferase involved in cell wall biosynthesis